MDQATHNRSVSFIWGIADDVLRDLFKRGKYPDVILPMVRREVARHVQRCDGKQIRVTVSRVLTAALGWHFKPNLYARLEEAPT